MNSKKAIFYLSGFDPRGARYYHNLYKDEAKINSNTNYIKYEISNKKRVDKNVYLWKVKKEDKKSINKTDYFFLSWDDIIRNEWSKGIISYYKDLFLLFFSYFLTGLVFKFAKESKTQLIAGFYPIIYILMFTFFSIYMLLFSFAFFENIFLGGVFGLVFAYILIKFALQIGNKFAVFWILRIMVFGARYAKKDIKDIEKRVLDFSEFIQKTISNKEYDEIIIVSHSVGTILNTNILANVLRNIEQNSKKNNIKKLKVLTLGECIPLTSFHKNATWYRDDLAYILENHNIVWQDYTSAIDGACFPNYDFSKDINNKLTKIEFLSPRFHTQFSKKEYKKLKKNKYKSHFLYLYSPKIKSDYDYFFKTN